jgi:hypothetical protein
MKHQVKTILLIHLFVLRGEDTLRGVDAVQRHGDPEGVQQ